MDVTDRWNSNVLLRNEEIDELWRDHFTKDSKVLFLLGKGFDPRMNSGITKFLNNRNASKLECLMVEFEEAIGSSSKAYESMVEENFSALKALIPSSEMVVKKIKIWSEENKRRIGDRMAADLFSDENSINCYTDIILDISALPRGIYFSLLAKLIILIDSGDPKINLFVVTTENAKLDYKITEEAIEQDLNYQYGFASNLESDIQLPILWLPLLGENKNEQFVKANDHISPNEVCPVLPFPAKNPRRSDDILINHREILFDGLHIVPQNILYASEQNPFEVYSKIMATFDRYETSFKILGGCRAVISSFSSKLISIGALLAAYELLYIRKKRVNILNVDSLGYTIDDVAEAKNLRAESEVFVTWLTGKPYQD
ncbi:hypothetical protein BH10BAC4_BH10BAC4_02350 [soil metagenome]